MKKVKKVIKKSKIRRKKNNFNDTENEQINEILKLPYKLYKGNITIVGFLLSLLLILGLLLIRNPNLNIYQKIISVLIIFLVGLGLFEITKYIGFKADKIRDDGLKYAKKVNKNNFLEELEKMQERILNLGDFFTKLIMITFIIIITIIIILFIITPGLFY